MSAPRRIYRFRNYLVSLPLIFAFAFNHYEVEADEIIWPLAIVIVLAGIALRIWGQQHLHYRVGMRKQLTTTGPYGFVRNPLYIGNMIMCVGATIASELFWLIPITIFWCIGIYSTVVRYEERHLVEKYGDRYRRYLLKVPGWLPKGLRFKNLDLINKNLYRVALIELSGILILLPYIIKEILNR
jgi:protein-S-isoprenylcysteine O-methyltransferase Ste14